jgi:C-terminal processing protease CtpA/Prc
VRDYFFPQPKERQVAVSRLEAIFADLRLAAGVVVDLRGSGGGSFPLMKALISRLIQEPVPNFKRRWLVSDTFVKYHEWGHRFGSGRRLTEWMCDGWGDQAEIAPAEGPRLSRGVALVVLTDGWTFSRSEALVQLLREAGLASSLGETTGGGYGLPLQLSLPRTGCSLWYSVGEGRSPQGFDIEGQGIPPDFPVSLGLADVGKAGDRYLEEAERFVRERL